MNSQINQNKAIIIPEICVDDIPETMGNGEAETALSELDKSLHDEPYISIKIK